MLYGIQNFGFPPGDHLKWIVVLSDMRNMWKLQVVD